MQNFGELNKGSARRPYWLLLALVLFFAGQVAVSTHWHDVANTLDADCALCVLSSATSAAIASDALNIASIVLCSLLLIEFTCVFVFRRTYAYQSRAPPLYS